jgi:hypothetical protein
MIEEWRDVVRFEKSYSISINGRLKSKDRVVVDRNGVEKFKSGKIIKLHTDKKGYCRYRLSENSNAKTCKIHRLVAEAFINNTENLPQVNHKNGIKHDNRVCNLEWITNEENMRHSIKTGLKVFKKGLENKKTKLDIFQILTIKTLPIAKPNCNQSSEWSASKLSDIYNISESVINKIRNSRNNYRFLSYLDCDVQ